MNYSTRPAWRNQWLAITVAVLLFFLSILVPIGSIMMEAYSNPLVVGLFAAIFIFLVITILYRRYSWRFSVTDQAIESQEGIIARDVKSIRIKDLRNVNLRQSFFQRIFGIGDLEFSSSGGGGVEVFFYGIYKPMELKRQVEALQRNKA